MKQETKDKLKKALKVGGALAAGAAVGSYLGNETDKRVIPHFMFGDKYKLGEDATKLHTNQDGSTYKAEAGGAGKLLGGIGGAIAGHKILNKNKNKNNSK